MGLWIAMMMVVWKCDLKWDLVHGTNFWDSVYPILPAQIATDLPENISDLCGTGREHRKTYDDN